MAAFGHCGSPLGLGSVGWILACFLSCNPEAKENCPVNLLNKDHVVRNVRKFL
jgi:hypothetical protein